jgi:hypothetical protein
MWREAQAFIKRSSSLHVETHEDAAARWRRRASRQKPVVNSSEPQP